MKPLKLVPVRSAGYSENWRTGARREFQYQPQEYEPQHVTLQSHAEAKDVSCGDVLQTDAFVYAIMEKRVQYADSPMASRQDVGHVVIQAYPKIELP